MLNSGSSGAPTTQSQHLILGKTSTGSHSILPSSIVQRKFSEKRQLLQTYLSKEDSAKVLSMRKKTASMAAVRQLQAKIVETEQSCLKKDEETDGEGEKGTLRI